MIDIKQSKDMAWGKYANSKVSENLTYLISVSLMTVGFTVSFSFSVLPLILSLLVIYNFFLQMDSEITKRLKIKGKTEKEKETVKPTVINDTLIK
jgi:hypothetical protein